MNKNKNQKETVFLQISLHLSEKSKGNTDN